MAKLSVKRWNCIEKKWEYTMTSGWQQQKQHELDSYIAYKLQSIVHHLCMEIVKVSK